MITIVDYGMGNLMSIQKALEYLDIPSAISTDSSEIFKSSGIILPGVGAFPDAMKNMRERGLDKIIRKAADGGKPILGICLGMQLLFDEGEEIIKCNGLGILKGNIKRLDWPDKIPHMGWNNISIKRNCDILKGVMQGTYLYFVHSYYAAPEEEGIVNACSPFGGRIPAVVSRGRIFGTQFHPEKSGEEGLRILKNFGELTVQ